MKKKKKKLLTCQTWNTEGREKQLCTYKKKKKKTEKMQDLTSMGGCDSCK